MTQKRDAIRTSGVSKIVDVFLFYAAQRVYIPRTVIQSGGSTNDRSRRRNATWGFEGFGVFAQDAA
ncbi:hypothetical protein BH18ACT10_BH18ACT10_17240 [soil metagenome]